MLRNNLIRIQGSTQQCFRRHLTVQASQADKNYAAKNEMNDLSEVKHHENFAADWWDPNGVMHALHSLNIIRVPFIRDGLIATKKVNPNLINTDRVLQGLNILEAGCGGGILTENLARIHGNVVGIDLSNKLIKIAEEHLNTQSTNLTKRIQYKNESIEKHEQNNQNKYDAVVVSEVIEHVTDKAKFLSSCVNTLKPGGSIFITTLNKTMPSLLGSVLIAEYVLGIVPKGTHDWNKFISPIETQRILESLNCSVVLINGFTHEFWRNTWKWIPSTSFSYAIQAIKCE